MNHDNKRLQVMCSHFHLFTSYILSLSPSRASGEVKGGIVVEMKSSEKGNEEAGLLNKPHAEQVRGHRQILARWFSTVQKKKKKKGRVKKCSIIFQHNRYMYDVNI